MTAFDPHDRREQLKLVRDEGDRALYENRDDVPCPVCERPFDRVLLTERRRHRETAAGALCLLREDDRLFLFAH